MSLTAAWTGYGTHEIVKERPSHRIAPQLQHARTLILRSGVCPGVQTNYPSVTLTRKFIYELL